MFPETDTVLLSVVVIGRNEGPRLKRCLESVKALEVDGEVEIIYVDSNSTDGSRDLAASMGALVLSIGDQRPTAALGRNLGWQAAHGPCILFLDGDTIVEPEFVMTALREFRNQEVAVVWGHRRELHPEKSLYNRVLDLDWIYAPGISDFCGGDALMRKAVLEEVGGYDSTLIAGEEPEMCNRIRQEGYIIQHIDCRMTGHDLAMTRFSQYWRRAYRAGHAYSEISERFRGTESPLWSHEVRHHYIRAGMFILLFLAGLVGSIALMSVFPALVALGLFALLILRTASRARWKSSDPLTLALYALHSHLQHIPIACGQFGRRIDHLLKRKRGLIDYKEQSNA